MRRGGRLHAPSRRIHDGSNGGSGPGSRSSPFRMRNLQRSAGRPSPGREIPHAPQTRSPRLPKHGKRSGRGATGDQMEGKGGVRMRSSAASGCPCACGTRVTHTICKRYRSHIPTQNMLMQIYSYADILYCSYILPQILLLLQLYSHHILTTSSPLTSSPPHSKLATALPRSLHKEIYKETGLPPPLLASE